MTPQIVVVGSFNADLVTYVHQLPAPGETIRGHKFVTGPGGKGSNQATAAARLGADTTFVGCVGQDGFAEIGLTLWREAGINTQYVSRNSVLPTGVASIFVEDSGENVIVITPGANQALGKAEINAAKDVIAQAKVLLVQLEIDLEIVTYALRTAKDHGVTTILNPAPAAELLTAILQYADYLTPNEHELQKLAGNDQGTIEENARKLLSRDDQTVIVTLGEEGAQWVRRDGTGRLPSYKVNAIDAVGAGDSFNGALAVALAENLALPEALSFANAAAAISVTRPGAAASMPTRAEVDTFLKSQ